MKLKIGTLNCQNNADNRSNRKDRAHLLAHHILDKKYDILGTQELTIRFTKKVDKYLRVYNFYGDYQYGRGIIGTFTPVLRSFNQGNHVISRIPALSVSTKALPWLRYSWKDFKRAWKKKSIARRIVTRVEMEVEEKRVYIFNTHLDYYTPALQEKQLAYLIKQIRKYRNYGFVVVMGDFNLETTDTIFQNFRKELEKMNIIKVPVNEKTNASKYREKTSIDHIFIPGEWKILECGTISTETLSYLTDHKAVYVVVSTH